MKLFPAKPIAALVPAAFLLAHDVVSAHPGHYHPPGEEDEFDALRADWLHLHGGFEVALALTALAAAFVALTTRRSGLRIGAAVALCGSLALIAAA